VSRASVQKRVRRGERQTIGVPVRTHLLDAFRLHTALAALVLGLRIVCPSSKITLYCTKYKFIMMGHT